MFEDAHLLKKTSDAEHEAPYKELHTFGEYCVIVVHEYPLVGGAGSDPYPLALVNFFCPVSQEITNVLT